jgi:hypothetical protein
LWQVVIPMEYVKVKGGLADCLIIIVSLHLCAPQRLHQQRRRAAGTTVQLAPWPAPWPCGLVPGPGAPGATQARGRTTQARGATQAFGMQPRGAVQARGRTTQARSANQGLGTMQARGGSGCGWDAVWRRPTHPYRTRMGQTTSTLLQCPRWWSLVVK